MGEFGMVIKYIDIVVIQNNSDDIKMPNVQPRLLSKTRTPSWLQCLCNLIMKYAQRRLQTICKNNSALMKKTIPKSRMLSWRHGVYWRP